jgi:2-aminoethylphosphonate-pyruvate transaminase
VNAPKPEDRMGRRILFTPGPLTTTRTVKEAMLIDIGSWDRDSIELVAEVRKRLAELAGAEGLTVTPFQGSGTFAVEAVLGSALPRDGKLLILKNGAYGQRMALIAEALRIPARLHADPEERPHDPSTVGALLDEEPAITHVACVHCETTTGILNPIREIGLEVGRRGRRFIVDAMSSFAAYPSGPGEVIDFDAGPIDHLVSSANKCIEGVPGFAFVISRREAVLAAEGQARSLSLDLHGQWSHLEKTGQFRYTPPTHVLLAFRQALLELAAEGGPRARARRYAGNHRLLLSGMRELGFEPFLPEAHRSHIITAFRYPHPRFDFRSFYDRLHARGYIIYPGKLGSVETFRIGTIGSIGAAEVRGLLGAIGEVVREGI